VTARPAAWTSAAVATSALALSLYRQRTTRQIPVVVLEPAARA